MKRKYYLLVLLIAMSFGSCKKYLDTKPTDFLNPSNYYTTVDQLNSARAGVYNDMQAFTNTGNYLYAWSADEAYMNRTSLTTGPWNYFYNAADSYTATLWNGCFDGINRANALIANVNNNTGIPQATRDQIRGEMLFMRGYFYFQLVTYFGGVPIKTKPTTDIVNVDLARNSVKEVYAQIISDMQAAEPLVASIAVSQSASSVSKSAVRGILARVNLRMAGQPLNDKTRYAEADKWAKMVMDDAAAAHILNPNYPQIFVNIAQDKYDIKESIWEVEYWGNGSTTFAEAGNNAYINGPTSNATHGTGVAYMTVTSKLYDSYEAGDNRKWWDIAHFTYSTAVGAVNGDKVMVASFSQMNKNVTAQPGKYRREYETLLPKNAASTPENVPLLRFSDILLMYAEAENEVNNGPTPAAIAAVNLVRQRAWSNGVKSVTITNGGSGYTTAPTVTFSAGAGTGFWPKTATATATITGGAVTAITLNRDLTGVTYNVEGQYSSPPTITITGGGGTGATATAAIYMKTDGNLTAAQTASHDAFLSFIQDERMRELNMEGLRKADLIRWGLFLKVNQDMGNKILQEWPAGTVQAKYYSNVTQRDLLMPIPSTEIITNQKMTQNPGF